MDRWRLFDFGDYTEYELFTNKRSWYVTKTVFAAPRYSTWLVVI